ncbi:MAG: type II secretion system protein [Nitrospirae bacterium]|nr:type II secretion system protein [Nitrospirota bacterium]
MKNENYGFTLLELIVVIFIISLATALIMPSFIQSPESALKSEAKHISSTMRYVYDQAMGRKEAYLFRINPEDSSWGFEGSSEKKVFKAKEDVKFKDVLIPSAGELTTKEVTVKFGPLGPEEPIVLHLISSDTEYTVIFNNLNGKSKIVEGYIL